MLIGLFRQTTKYAGVHYYRTVISGILYTFLVTEKDLPIAAEQIAINEQGIFLMVVDRVENIEFLRESVMQHSKALNERNQTKKLQP
jgi:hypothetical protein